MKHTVAKLLSVAAVIALGLAVAPFTASAAQPQSGQPGYTEGQNGQPAPGHLGGGGKQHNNGN